VLTAAPGSGHGRRTLARSPAAGVPAKATA
jgi:hypothetical protein